MQKMTIHRGLSELKLIDAKIDKQINELVPSGFYQKGKLINGYVQENEFQKTATSKFDSINDLIQRKGLIKSAIVAANGVTKVSIGTNEMTIADAITFKATIKFKKKLIETLKQRHRQVVGELNKNNELVNKNAQALLEAAVGKDNVKNTSNDTVDSIQKPYLSANEFLLFDPLKVDETVGLLEKEVSEFEAEVDAVLSEINAVTFIEV